MINHHEVPYASLWAPRTFKRRRNTTWPGTLSSGSTGSVSPMKKNTVFFLRKSLETPHVKYVFNRRVWQAPQCGGQVQTYFKHKNLLATADFALVKVFSSNILSLEFAVSCPPWKWSQDLLSALSSRAAITSMEA